MLYTYLRLNMASSLQQCGLFHRGENILLSKKPFLFVLIVVFFSTADIIPSDWAGADDAPAPIYPFYEHYFRFIFTFRNIVDLVTILPHYISLGAMTSHNGAIFLRVFRLLRIFKLLRRFKEMQVMFRLLVRTIEISLPALGILILFIAMGFIFFGSLVYPMEAGKFTVSPLYPQGVYLRQEFDGYRIVVSMFDAIPDTIYFVLTTFATGKNRLSYQQMKTRYKVNSLSCQ